jgi:hypothetical protein
LKYLEKWVMELFLATFADTVVDLDLFECDFLGVGADCSETDRLRVGRRSLLATLDTDSDLGPIL